MAATKRNALGKGLSALIEENSINDGVTEVDIMRIEPAKDQPRKNFDNDKLEDLADSIRTHGLIQPIVVTENGRNYQIIAGERRWRAARLAGLKKIPVIIRQASEKEIRELALIENIQREDLNPIEEARAYRQLLDDYKLTQDELAGIVGKKSRSEIANRVRLLNLAAEVQKMLEEKEITAGQARPLLGLPDSAQLTAARTIVEKGLNARQAEALVKSILSGNKCIADDDGDGDDLALMRDIETMQNKLRSVLGTKVKLNDKDGKGKIVIEYFSRDERERLLDYLLRSKK